MHSVLTVQSHKSLWENWNPSLFNSSLCLVRGKILTINFVKTSHTFSDSIVHRPQTWKMSIFLVLWTMIRPHLGLSRLCLQNAQKLLTGMLKSCYLNFRTWLTLVKKNSLKLGIKRVSCKYGRNLRIPKLVIIARNKSSYIAKSHNRTIMALGCKQYKLIRYQNL